MPQELRLEHVRISRVQRGFLHRPLDVSPVNIARYITWLGDRPGHRDNYKHATLPRNHQQAPIGPRKPPGGPWTFSHGRP